MGLRVHTFIYTGTGVAQTIAVPFTPVMSLIKRNVGITSVFKLTPMPFDNSWRPQSGTPITNRIIEHTSSGISIGTTNEVNQIFGVYHGYALGGDSSCAYSGTYTGNGTATNLITGVGFQYDLLFIQRASGSVGQMAWGAAGTHTLIGTDLVTTNVTRNSDGFTINTALATYNSAGIVYYFAAFKFDAGFAEYLNYTGNGVDNRAINSSAVSNPILSIVKCTTGSTGYEMVFATAQNVYNDCCYHGFSDWNLVNEVQDLLSNGIEVGSGNRANQNTLIYNALILKDNPRALTLSIDPQTYTLNFPDVGVAYQRVLEVTPVNYALTLNSCDLYISRTLPIDVLNYQLSLVDVDLTYTPALGAGNIVIDVVPLTYVLTFPPITLHSTIRPPAPRLTFNIVAKEVTAMQAIGSDRGQSFTTTRDRGFTYYVTKTR